MNSTLVETASIRDHVTRVLRWCSASTALALALAGCGGGGETVTPTATMHAAPDQVAALTLAQQSVNARAALPRPVALAAVSAQAATEDFENGMADWQNWGNAEVVAGAGTSGSKAMQVGTAAGGAGLAVPGIVPGTAYRLTAQVKVSDPSDPVFIGINMLTSTGSQVVGHSSPAVSNTGYVTVTVDLVAPANSALAIVWVWKNDGSGYASLDDVSFGRPTSPPPPPPAPPGSNLVSNGGFESGMTGWVNWGNASAVSGQASSGTSALSVGTGAGGAGQSVSGITGGTVYRLVAQAKVSDPSETVFVGVNLLNQSGAAVAQMASPVSSTTYNTVTFDITAPSDAVSAVVYVWKNAGSGLGVVDDVVFGVVPGSAPPPPPPGSSGNLVANGGFENGLANWVNWGNTVAASGQAAAGSYAAQVGTGDGGFGQIVGGVVAGTTYSATARLKLSVPGEVGYFGLKFMDAAGTVLGEKFVGISATGYSLAQVDLAAPANAASALVYVWKNAGSGYAYVDEVTLAERPAIVPLTVTSEQVNPVESGHNYYSPAMARLTTGGYVIVWERTTPAGNGTSTWDVCFRRYDASGAASAPAACVAGVHSVIGSLLVGALPGGGFTIGWNEGTSSADPAGWRWQDYDQSGTAQGAIQSGPLPLRLSAKPLAGGGYVQLLGTRQPNNAVTVAFQLYAADGTPIGAAQTVSDTAGYAGNVVGLPDGGFAVTWGDGASVAMTRAYSADGSARGGPVAIAPNTLGPIICTQGGGTCSPWQNLLGITAAADGGYIVAWLDGTGIAAAGDTFARQFRADGSPASKVVGRIGTRLTGPIMTVGADSFVMAVETSSSNTGGPTGIGALHVDAVPLR